MQFKVAMAEGLQMVVSQDNIATVRMNNGENRFRMSFSKAWMKILDEIERLQISCYSSRSHLVKLPFRIN